MNRFAPVLTANDPLPVEIVAAADDLSHRSGDLLMRASEAASAGRRGLPLDALAGLYAALAAEAKATADLAERVAQTIAYLKTRASA